jgi:hypothetical protein
MKPKVAFLIRGHIRDSLEDRKLNDFLLSCQDAIDFDLYIQTWDKKEASQSWRDLKIKRFLVDDQQILSYFSEPVKSKIKDLSVLDDSGDSQLYLHGNLKGNIGKTKCPTISWKRMWAGMRRNISQVSGDYDFAINTRFDIFNNDLNKFCRMPRNREWLMPLKHLDLIKRIASLSSYNDLSSTHTLYKEIGCDNFFCSRLDHMKLIINSFHFDLDKIIDEWLESDFSLNRQECCFEFFCKNNGGLNFSGNPINPKDFENFRREYEYKI